jgi:protein O-mannosyl-transferase
LSSGDYWLALLFFVLGLLSKPVLVTLPCVMLLLDVWPLRRIQFSALNSQFLKRPLLEKTPFFVLGILSAVATTAFQKQAGALQTLGGYSMSARLENGLVGYVHYLGKIFWPTALATPYPRVFHWPLIVVLPAGSLIAIFCASAIFQLRQRPFLFMGWFWFFGTLIPVIGVIQVGAASVADRYAYWPSIGVFVLIVWGVAEICSRWKPPRLMVGVAVAIVLAVCSARTRDQVRHWQNSGTLFEHAINVSKRNWIAHYCLGLFYDEHGRGDDALRQYRRATEIEPNYAEAWNSLGVALADKKDFGQASPCFEFAVRARPDVAEYRYNFARALGILGKVEEAISQFRRVLQLKPDLATAHNDLAVLLARSGKPDEAIAHFRETLRLQPSNPTAHYHLGKILLAGGKRDEAIEHLRAALRLRPDFAQAREVLRTLNAAMN